MHGAVELEVPSPSTSVMNFVPAKESRALSLCCNKRYRPSPKNCTSPSRGESGGCRPHGGTHPKGVIRTMAEGARRAEKERVKGLDEESGDTT